ncbi:glycosyltransferase [Bradyrhizobium sp. USDA 4486]
MVWTSRSARSEAFLLRLPRTLAGLDFGRTTPSDAPVNWLATGAGRSPLCLVMIEAIACGAPVIAPSHGSAPEIIDHGLSGFVVQP